MLSTIGTLLWTSFWPTEWDFPKNTNQTCTDLCVQYVSNFISMTVAYLIENIFVEQKQQFLFLLTKIFIYRKFSLSRISQKLWIYQFWLHVNSRFTESKSPKLLERTHWFRNINSESFRNNWYPWKRQSYLMLKEIKQISTKINNFLSSLQSLCREHFFATIKFLRANVILQNGQIFS